MSRIRFRCWLSATILSHWPYWWYKAPKSTDDFIVVRAERAASRRDITSSQFILCQFYIFLRSVLRFLWDWWRHISAFLSMMRRDDRHAFLLDKSWRLLCERVMSSPRRNMKRHARTYNAFPHSPTLQKPSSWKYCSLPVVMRAGWLDLRQDGEHRWLIWAVTPARAEKILIEDINAMSAVKCSLYAYILLELEFVGRLVSCELLEVCSMTQGLCRWDW